MIQKLSVLVIEDEKSICDFIGKTLTSHDYKVTTATTGKEGLAILTSSLPDVVLLDLGLPDMDGIDIIKQTREWSSLPIIVISARVQEREKVAALDAGADDYITKPFIPKEVVARVQAHLRRKGNGSDEQVIILDNLRIDLNQKEVYKDGELINLFTKEKKLLFYLVENANRVVSSEQIIDEVWGYEGVADAKTVAVHVSTLRRKLGDSYSKASWIQTVRGFGYKFVINQS